MAKFPNLADYDRICPDVETDGLQWYKNDRPFGLAITLPTGYSEYYDLRTDLDAYQWAREQFPKIRKAVNHNIKFDWHMLRVVGIHMPPEKCECTMIRAALINEHLMDYSLDALAKKYLKHQKMTSIYDELAALFGGSATKSAQVKNFPRAPRAMMKRYACADTEAADELWRWQEKEIYEKDRFGFSLEEVWMLEKRLFPHLCRSEMRGIRVDVEYAEAAIPELTSRIEQNIYELKRDTRIDIEVNSGKSLEAYFKPKQHGLNAQGQPMWFTKSGEQLMTTGGGKPSYSKDSIKGLKDPVAQKVIATRKLIKTRDTFISGHVLGHQVNGRVHPNINQTKSDTDDGSTQGTGTGRLSYTEPALQQIPSRDKETARLVRPIFLPEVGQKWTYGDLDQHEFRIFAHYAKPKELLKAYEQDPNLDMHQIVADLTGLPRSAQESGGANAKQINLAMVFNMGGGELAARMGLPYTWDSAIFDGETEPRWFKRAGQEAIDVMETYYSRVPGVREVARQASSLAKSRKYVRTMYGRHIHFPGGKFAYKASGLVYQGTAADFNKKNICLVAEYIEAECPHNNFLLSVHDEYSFSMIDEGDISVHHLKEMKRMIQDKGLLVPISIDFCALSDNWWEATQAELVTK